jgi:hypothetical protein
MTDSSTASTAVNTLVPVTSDAGTVLVEGKISVLIFRATFMTLGNVTTVPPSPDVERQLVNPRAVRRHHNPLDLVSLAAQVQCFTENTVAMVVGFTPGTDGGPVCPSHNRREAAGDSGSDSIPAGAGSLYPGGREERCSVAPRCL